MQPPYYSFSSYLKKKFAPYRVRKIPINAGFPCPNKDGTVSKKGCIFCDTYGSGPIKHFELPIREQIQGFIGQRSDLRFLAYYQAHSNTSGPVDELRKRYEIIFDYPQIVGLFIGTRPDSIAENVYPLLEELNEKTYLTIELGLQSIHPKSLEFLRRNHTYDQFLETFSKLKERNIDVVVHHIIGIPGESREDMLESIKEMNRLKPAGIKFHLMHVLKNTPLLDLYEQNKFTLLEQDEYVNLMVYLLERLDPSIVIHRLTGERDAEIFHAPQWAMDKNAVIEAIRIKIIAMRTSQGRLTKNSV